MNILEAEEKLKTYWNDVPPYKLLGITEHECYFLIMEKMTYQEEEKNPLFVDKKRKFTIIVVSDERGILDIYDDGDYEINLSNDDETFDVIKRMLQHYESIYGINNKEIPRIILGLRSSGWNDKKINDFLLYITTGEEQYKPK